VSKINIVDLLQFIEKYNNSINHNCSISQNDINAINDSLKITLSENMSAINDSLKITLLENMSAINDSLKITLSENMSAINDSLKITLSENMSAINDSVQEALDIINYEKQLVLEQINQINQITLSSITCTNIKEELLAKIDYIFEIFFHANSQIIMTNYPI
jgi:hypothetical protein